MKSLRAIDPTNIAEGIIIGIAIAVTLFIAKRYFHGGGSVL